MGCCLERRAVRVRPPGRGGRRVLGVQEDSKLLPVDREPDRPVCGGLAGPERTRQRDANPDDRLTARSGPTKAGPGREAQPYPHGPFPAPLSHPSQGEQRPCLPGKDREEQLFRAFAVQADRRWVVAPAKLTVAAHVLASMVAPALGPLPLRAAARVLWPLLRGTSRGVQPRTDADFAMERYAGGDSAAFAQVYDALAPRLYGYLLRQTRDRARAEDLLQQTMLHIHRARDRFIAGAEVRPWAFAIARRLLVDEIRRGRRVILSDDGDPDLGVSDRPMADEVVQAGELALRIQVILAKLPTSQRAAFELIKQEGLTVAEAAQVLGTTVAAVKLRAHRAYEALRAALGEIDPGLEGGNP
jgi:RNA polymerase sigma-70 factor (ECF subfamily)